MAPRKRQRRHPKTINEEEGPNILIDKLSGDDFVLEFTSITFANVIPEYEVMEEKVEELADTYDEKILNYYEAVQRMLKEQRDNLKDAVLQKNSKIKIPKTPKGDKNVSKTLGIWKGRVTKKNHSFDPKPLSNTNGTSRSGIVAVLRPRVNNQASSAIGSGRNSKNVASASCRVRKVKKRNRDTTKRAIVGF
uniref:Uncharacterized protein n=1 Tax=Strongyloides papillosus TaxID=174720 RepID=A0A0N5BPJ8_STREA